ncbi:MAG: exonuclease domain-containing protein [Patescibacteria group bacterium]
MSARTPIKETPISVLAGGAYAFVDVETTGMSATYGQIIEIGIIRVEDSVITDSYQTLIKPDGTLPPIITSITGIMDRDLEDAPPFEAVSGRILELLTDAVFVAHNASFDYAFVKSEFARVGIRFNAKSLCTVKLSRKLYPEQRSHNLDALIERHGLAMKNRHRAYDDAYAMVGFVRSAAKEYGEELVRDAIKAVLGQRALPSALDPKLLSGLPHAPGIYIFYGAEDEVLYVGKSVDIRTRVMSHFSADRRTGKERALCEATTHIEHEETSGELSALLLESVRIKELMPVHNRRLRKAKKLAVITSTIDENGFVRAVSAYRDELTLADFGSTWGVFRTASQGKAALKAAAREHALCPKLLGLEQGAGPCFQYQLGRCEGACIGEELPASHNARLEKAFEKQRVRSWPFPGAMLLPEDPTAEEGTVYVIDQWRVQKMLTYTADGYDEEDVESEFDYDSYKILVKHLLRPDVRSKLMPYRERREDF